jgi:hypothetical protein
VFGGANMNEWTIPVSLGELLDKISILRIKMAKISDPNKKFYIWREAQDLLMALGDSGPYEEYLREFHRINTIIWDATEEMAGCFEAGAEKAYQTNKERFALKDKVNKEFNSALREQKSSTMVLA